MVVDAVDELGVDGDEFVVNEAHVTVSPVFDRVRGTDGVDSPVFEIEFESPGIPPELMDSWSPVLVVFTAMVQTLSINLAVISCSSFFARLF